MSLAYRILYAIGFTPWEQMADPAIAKQIAELFAREEEGREAPYGTALDLGCGSGIWAVELARRGWHVTGVDFVAKALRRARDRARQSDVELRLFQRDVTDLRSTDPVPDSSFYSTSAVFTTSSPTSSARPKGVRQRRRRHLTRRFC